MIQLHNGLLVSGIDFMLVGDERLSKWGDCDKNKCYKALKNVYELYCLESRYAISKEARAIAHDRVNKEIDAGRVSMIFGERFFDWEVFQPVIPAPFEVEELFQNFFDEECKRIFNEKLKAIEDELFNGDEI